MMRNRGIRFWLGPTAVFFALLLLLVPISLLAQDQDPGQTTDENELSDAEKIDLAQQGEELLARLEILIGQGRLYKEKLATASAEDSLVFLLYRHAFFRFYRLVQTIRPSAAGHGSTRKFVDDNDFTVFDNVVDVALINRMRAQSAVEVVQQSNIAGIIETLTGFEQSRLHHQGFYFLMTVLGDVRLLALLVRCVIASNNKLA